MKQTKTQRNSLRAILGASLAVALTAAALTFTPSAPAEAAQDRSWTDKNQIFVQTNQYRTQNKKAALAGSKHLDKIAQDWAEHMAKNNDYRHNPNVAAQTRKTAGWTWAGGENIAAGQADGKAVAVAWWNSPGHKQNILFDNYNRIGIGAAYGGKYGTYYVQVFGFNTGADVADPWLYVPKPPKVLSAGDTIARDASGALWNYGNLYNGGKPRVKIGTGWSGFRSLTVTDLNGDGHQDIVGANSNGKLYLYKGIPGGFEAGKIIGSGGWANLQITAMKMKKTDKYPSIITRLADGKINLYSTNGSAITSTKTIGSGWQGFTSVNFGYFDNDGNLDAIARNKAGQMILYRTNGAGFINEKRPVVGSGWKGFTALYNDANFMTAKGGLTAKNSAGKIIYYPFNGSRGWGKAKTIGTGGWNPMVING